MKKINIGLCRGRHEIDAVEGKYLFDEINIDKLDNEFVDALEESAKQALFKACEVSETAATFGDGEYAGLDYSCQATMLNLYVTGLTVALTAVIKAAAMVDGLHLRLYHFDRVSGEYTPQIMF